MAHTRKPQESQDQSTVREPVVVSIPAGPFLMGSLKSDERRDPEEPEQVERTLTYDYAIGKYLVTVGEYRAFIEAGAYQTSRYWTTAGWRLSSDRTQPDHWTEALWAGEDDLPVIGVTWFEASAYARWLAESTGRDYRLPTEAEWEKAARGGLWLSSAEGVGQQANPNPGRSWPGGESEPDDTRLNFGSRRGHTTPVGAYAAGASPYGALDMAGNVWEWLLDRWVDRSATLYQRVANPPTAAEPDEPEDGGYRAARGGSWFNTAAQARCSYRLRLPANLRLDHDVGFRVACGPSSAAGA